MKLSTTIDVTHADVTKKLTGGTKKSIVTMTLGDYQLVKEGENIRFAQSYMYHDAEGNKLESLQNDKFDVLTTEELKNASKLVNPMLPATDNIIDHLNESIKLFAKMEMSKAFGIPITQITEIV